MSVIKIWWRVTCEFCQFIDEAPLSREEAIENGRAHVAKHHADDPEWAFRIQRWRKVVNEKPLRPLDGQQRVEEGLKRLEEIDGPVT